MAETTGGQHPKLASMDSSPGVLIVQHTDGHETEVATEFVHEWGATPPATRTVECGLHCHPEAAS